MTPVPDRTHATAGSKGWDGIDGLENERPWATC